MKSLKVRNISTSRSGLKIDKLDLDIETLSLVIPDNDKYATIAKADYVKRMKDRGIILTHQKDIHYKKPFWKFWGMKDYSIAVYKITSVGISPMITILDLQKNDFKPGI